MAQCIFKVNGNEVELEKIENLLLRQRCERVANAVRGTLRSLRCKTHFQEPVIILQIDGDCIVLSGIGACCRDFTTIVNDVLRPLALETNETMEDGIFTVRTIRRKYSAPSRGSVG